MEPNEDVGNMDELELIITPCPLHDPLLYYLIHVHSLAYACAYTHTFSLTHSFSGTQKVYGPSHTLSCRQELYQAH